MMNPISTGSKPAVGGASDSDAVRLLELIHEISKCHRLVRGALQGLARRWELSDTDFLVLWLCQRADPAGMAQSELATATGVSAARMSGLVEDLRRRGYLTSRRSATDRRRQLWRTTANGCEVLQGIGACLIESSDTWGRTFSQQEQQSLMDLLRRFALAANRPDGLGLFREDAADRESCTEAQDARVQRRVG